MSANELSQSAQAITLAPAPGLRPAPLLAALSFHLNPVGPIERTLVSELARRANEMNKFDAALWALREAGGTALMGVLDSPDGGSAPQIVAAGVLSSSRHENLLRQSLASARGFSRTLRELDDSRSRSQAFGWNNPLSMDPRFKTESACCAHLVRRYDQGMAGCGGCGAIAEGGFIAARLCWQCSRCRAQTGLRVGTCMENSALPLTRWFAAVRTVLLTPSVTVADLATFLQIPRTQTVRKMTKRIREAAASDDATARLAGLDEVYLGQLT